MSNLFQAPIFSRIHVLVFLYVGPAVNFDFHSFLVSWYDLLSLLISWILTFISEMKQVILDLLNSDHSTLVELSWSRLEGMSLPLPIFHAMASAVDKGTWQFNSWVFTNGDSNLRVSNVLMGWRILRQIQMKGCWGRFTVKYIHFVVIFNKWHCFVHIGG